MCNVQYYNTGSQNPLVLISIGCMDTKIPRPKDILLQVILIVCNTLVVFQIVMTQQWIPFWLNSWIPICLLAQVNP